MAGFEKAEAARFSVSLLPEDGPSERVTVAVGLDGLFVLSPDGKRAMRKYPLNHISRWALRGTSLVLYTKTPVDVEERTVTLQADDTTIRTVLDTLTCSCMQCAAPAPALASPASAAELSLCGLCRARTPGLPCWHAPDMPAAAPCAAEPSGLPCTDWGRLPRLLRLR